MKLLEIAKVLDIAPRIEANKIIELGNDRLEGMSWLNNKFKEISNKLIKSQKGSMRIVNNPDLIKIAIDNKNVQIRERAFVESDLDGIKLLILLAKSYLC